MARIFPVVTQSKNKKNVNPEISQNIKNPSTKDNKNQAINPSSAHSSFFFDALITSHVLPLSGLMCLKSTRDYQFNSVLYNPRRFMDGNHE